MRQPNDLSAFWLPFTQNRAFKANPRIIARAEGMYYYDDSGRALLDSCAGLWCCNVGHGRKSIADAIARSARELDFAPTFQYSHPAAFTLAQRVADLAPEGMDHVFFVNSGSEAADSALKIARAYFQKIGQGGRFRLIGREKGYHGTTVAGISVGGMGNNRKPYGPLLPGTDDHLPLPYDASMKFTRGEPAGGTNYADALEGLVALHGADTIAAVIVEPFSGSGGVYASSKEYFQKLRAICDKYGILLILDEVITGFGRLGYGLAAKERYGITPDIINFAKGVTSGTAPLGGSIVSNKIHDAFMSNSGPEYNIELFHGHTYTAHPIACAAGLATLDIYRDEGLFERAKKMEKVLEDAVHSLKGTRLVADIRNVGMAAGIEIEADPKAPGRRGLEAVKRAFEEQNLVVRVGGDTIALSPPLIVTESEIGKIIDGVRGVLEKLS